MVTLTFPTTCPPFSPCGGTLPGTYAYTSGCVDDAEFKPLIDAAANCGPNATTISNKAGTIQGGVIFSASQVSRFVQGTLSFTATIAGLNCANTMLCPTVIETLMTSYGVSGSCTLDQTVPTAPKCICGLSRALQSTSNENYTVSANQVRVTGSTTKVYDYCVTNAGANLVTHEVTPLDGGFYLPDLGYFSLSK